MNDLLKQISSYHLFNYLLPGCLFALIASRITHWNFIESQLVLGLFIYYFYGLVISRIGSLVIEPALKFTRFIRFAEYGDYVAACKADPKIEVLNESNNMYRTLCSTIFCLILLRGYEGFCRRFDWHFTIDPVVACLLCALFLFSYRKQTEYIKRRVAASKIFDSQPLVINTPEE
jgi:hypothetical protein